jgi:hypothetical protein
MSAQLTHKSGRIVTPKPGLLEKEQGIWVFNTGEPLSASTTDQVLQRIRKERDRANQGKAE